MGEEGGGAGVRSARIPFLPTTAVSIPGKTARWLSARSDFVPQRTCENAWRYSDGHSDPLRWVLRARRLLNALQGTDQPPTHTTKSLSKMSTVPILTNPPQNTAMHICSHTHSPWSPAGQMST